MCWPASGQGKGPAGPRVGSDLCWWTCSTGYRIIVILLLVSGLWWVRLVWRLVQASWLEETVPSHWWEELGLGPLVGRTMSRVGLVVAVGPGRL